MRRHLRNLAFLGYVVLVCFFAGEIATRALYGHFRDYNMEMWRYASDLKQPLRDPRLPFHHFPNREGSYYGAIIKTNSLGFRDREYTIRKPDGKKRIVVLGDSFTLGWGVPLDGVFSKVLERRLNEHENKYEVINMGVGNYNTTMEVELFKWKGLGLGPDMAILMYFINDTEPIPPQKSGFKYAIMKRSYFFSFLFDRLVRIRSRFVKAFEWSSYYRSLYSPENSENLASNRESMRELVRLCDESDVKLLIVNIPEMHEFKDYQFVYATDYVRRFAKESNVPFIDLLPAFSAYAPESLWVSSEDPHANARAHSIIAQQIYEKILRDRMLE